MTRSKHRSAVALLCAVVLGLTTQASAQSQYELFAGYLTDASGNPLTGTVAVNNASKATYPDGYFEIYTPAASSYVFRASKVGYVPVSRILAEPNEQLNIQMTRAEVFTVNPAAQIDVRDTRGTRIVIEPNSMVDAQGRLPSGPLQLSLHTFDLRNTGMVGDMTGVNANGQRVALMSIGAFSAEFTDANGALYNLAPGRTASITLQADPGNSYSGPVPLWYYNETTGLWVQEAMGEVQNGIATGRVPHFSVWNFDVEFNTPACIRFTIDAAYLYNQAGGALQVRFATTTPWAYSYSLAATTPGPHAIYNIPANATVEVYVNNQPYAIINSGAPWGSTGQPPRGAQQPYYSVCNGSILIDATPRVGRVAGQLLRQHRTNHGGVAVSVVSGSSTFSTATDSAGRFSLLVPTGTASASASRSGYLSIRRNSLTVTPGVTTTLPTVSLLAGEVTGDSCINQPDMASILNAIGSSAASTDPRDINGNLNIGYDDLSLASANGGLCGPMGW